MQGIVETSGWLDTLVIMHQNGYKYQELNSLLEHGRDEYFISKNKLP